MILLTIAPVLDFADFRALQLVDLLVDLHQRVSVGRQEGAIFSPRHLTGRFQQDMAAKYPLTEGQFFPLSRITAELGTMRVTDQISALRVMGADPIRQLVVPRFLACLLLTPLLTFFCDLCGSLAGWFVAVVLKGIPSSQYWYYIAYSIVKWDVMVGFIKSVVFGGMIALIACFKGFHCRTGAEGVGRACTESFVISFIAILVADFFIGTFLSGLYRALYGFKSLV